MGRPARRRFHNLLRPSLIEALVRELTNVDLVIV
jgi:K+-sensing histidine kinase KdpD